MNDAPMIHIGSKVEREAVNAIAKAICNVLGACKDSHLDQKTTRLALSTLQSAFAIKNISISHCQFHGSGSSE